MEREKISELYAWRDRPGRKPLVMRGARQVGKTWLAKTFAERAFEKSVYINFESDEYLNHVFEADFDVARILKEVELRTGTAIDSHTLVIFDEIQAARRGLTALKYFCEDAPEQPLIAAGSLLGLTHHPAESFPVGKVEFLDLYPMTFKEYLWALGHKAWADLIEQRRWDLLAVIRDKLIEALRGYYFVGGMPEVVSAFAANKSHDEARRIQLNILRSYAEDFSKHAPNEEVPRIRTVWQSIPGQLAKENKKFVYGLLKAGSRAKTFEAAIEWLKGAGLVYKINRCTLPRLPLNAYEDFNAFKLYLLDVGLLCAMNRLSAETLLTGNNFFTQFKGALTEQYVLEQLIDREDFIYYWSAENSSGEIDFLVQKKDAITPIEVKAEENLRAKSLKAFVEKNEGLHGVRLSMSDYRQQGWMENIPLYAV